MLRAAREYGLPQLEIVSTKLAICLGKSTYNALRVACGLDRVQGLAEAIKSPFSHGRTVVFCQAHPAGRGSEDKVLNNWSGMTSLYNSMPSNRAEIAEWFANNINCRNTQIVVAAAPAMPLAVPAVAAPAQARPGTVRYYCLQVLQANKGTPLTKAQIKKQGQTLAVAAGFPPASGYGNVLRMLAADGTVTVRYVGQAPDYFFPA